MSAVRVAPPRHRTRLDGSARLDGERRERTSPTEKPIRDGYRCTELGHGRLRPLPTHFVFRNLDATADDSGSNLLCSLVVG